ncbi:hypothetical protein [Noviherbaspirillum sp. ST9]|uniref:hypothetical protein n=1 Tax=Noviherbaspirillum sp. ST9 TaxID=3401606 RepID=UPI003B58ABB7
MWDNDKSEEIELNEVIKAVDTSWPADKYKRAICMMSRLVLLGFAGSKSSLGKLKGGPYGRGELPLAEIGPQSPHNSAPCKGPFLAPRCQVRRLSAAEQGQLSSVFRHGAVYPMPTNGNDFKVCVQV